MLVTKPIPKDILTGETFKFEVEPEKTAVTYIINTKHFKMYREQVKAYIYDGEIVEIDGGSFVKAVGEIAGLSDEQAADKVKAMFRGGDIKIKKTINNRKFYSHR